MIELIPPEKRECMEKMFDEIARQAEPRKKRAVENIEKARETFEKLSGELKNEPLLQAECLLGCAKAEAVLIAVLKDGKDNEFRGSAPKLIEYLDRLAEDAPDTP